MADQIPRAFRQYFHAHNFRAWLLAVASFLAAVTVWGALYLVIVWLGVLGTAVVRNVDAPMELRLWPVFLGVAGGLILLRLLARNVLGYRSERVDKFTWWKILLDLLLLPANLTFAIGANLSAQVFPSDHDLAWAWYLLQRLREEKKISLQQLPLEVSDPKQLENLQFLLGITGLTDTDNYGGTWWLHLKDDQSRRFVRRLEKLTARLNDEKV